MAARTILAIVLIALGIVGLTYGRLSYTTREKVVDLGPIEVTQEQRRWVPLPPILGGLSLAAGVVLLVTGAKRS